jgi:hypothetical protein
MENQLMPERTIAIELGSRSYTVRQLPIRADADWRKLARPLVEPIIEVAIQSGVTMPTPERLARLALINSILYEPGQLLDLVFAYAPALEDDRDWIEDNAYTDELMAALFTCFLAAAPAPPAPALAGVASKHPATI